MPGFHLSMGSAGDGESPPLSWSPVSWSPSGGVKRRLKRSLCSHFLSPEKGSDFLSSFVSPDLGLALNRYKSISCKGPHFFTGPPSMPGIISRCARVSSMPSTPTDRKPSVFCLPDLSSSAQPVRSLHWHARPITLYAVRAFLSLGAVPHAVSRPSSCTPSPIRTRPAPRWER